MGELDIRRTNLEHACPSEPISPIALVVELSTKPDHSPIRADGSYAVAEDANAASAYSHPWRSSSNLDFVSCGVAQRVGQSADDPRGVDLRIRNVPEEATHRASLIR